MFFILNYIKMYNGKDIGAFEEYRLESLRCPAPNTVDPL